MRGRGLGTRIPKTLGLGEDWSPHPATLENSGQAKPPVTKKSPVCAGGRGCRGLSPLGGVSSPKGNQGVQASLASPGRGRNVICARRRQRRDRRFCHHRVPTRPGRAAIKEIAVCHSSAESREVIRCSHGSVSIGCKSHGENGGRPTSADPLSWVITAARRTSPRSPPRHQ